MPLANPFIPKMFWECTYYSGWSSQKRNASSNSTANVTFDQSQLSTKVGFSLLPPALLHFRSWLHQTLLSITACVCGDRPRARRVCQAVVGTRPRTMSAWRHTLLGSVGPVAQIHCVFQQLRSQLRVRLETPDLPAPLPASGRAAQLPYHEYSRTHQLLMPMCLQF